jgi:hypothetical protein
MADKWDLAMAWQMIRISLGDINSDLIKLKHWNSHPMGKGIVLKLLENFQKQGDIQNISLLAALILGCETKIIENICDVKKDR